MVPPPFSHPTYQTHISILICYLRCWRDSISSLYFLFHLCYLFPLLFVPFVFVSRSELLPFIVQWCWRDFQLSFFFPVRILHAQFITPYYSTCSITTLTCLLILVSMFFCMTQMTNFLFPLLSGNSGFVVFPRSRSPNGCRFSTSTFP